MKKLLLTTAFIFVSLNVFSQEFATRLYTPKDGLVQAQVYCVTQGPQGYLWAGTLGGISRFDGLEFKSYTEQDGLSSNSVYQMQWFNDTLFILTKQGVDIMVNNKITNVFHDSTINFMMGRIKITPKYKYAIGHNYDYYFFLNINSGKITHFPKKLQLKGKMFATMTDTSFIVGKDNIIYEIPFGDTAYKKIATLRKNVGRIRFFQGQIFIILDLSNETQETYKCYYANIVRKSDNTGYKVLYKAVKAPYEYKLIDRIFYFKSGNIFYSSGIGNLFYEDKGNIVKFADKYNYILKAFEDNNGNIWFGTEKGLLKVFIGKFRYFRPEDGYPENVWSVAGINDSLILMATYNNGIHLYENGKEKEYINSVKHIQACYFTARYGFHNDILMSVYPGVARFDIQKNTLSLITNNLDAANFTLIKDDKHKKIYVGSLRTLVSMDKDYNTQKLFNTSLTGNSQFIMSLIQRNDKILLGLARGLVEFDPETKKARYILNDRTRYNAMVIDSANTIWAATNKGLLKILEDTMYFINDSRIPENINAAIIDNNNKLYFTSQTKLFTLNLTKHYKGKKNQLTYYGQYDGYYGINAQENAFFKDIKGNLWLPTGYNVIKIFPDELNMDDYKSNTLITGMSVSTGDTTFVPVDLSRKIVVKPVMNNVVINFLNINLQNPERTQYQCLLENKNRQWKSITKNRQISFNNLPPGSYSFTVKAAVTDDFESVTGKTLSFTIQPPFWQTGWFIMVTVLVLIAVIVLLLRYVKKREERKNRGKMEILKLKNQALTIQMDNHFIVNCTNKIVLLFEAGKVEEGNKYTRTFSRFLQQNLFFLRKETITLEEELNLIKNYVDLERIHGRDFNFQLEVNPNIYPAKIKIPPFLVQPIVENAIKHGVKKIQSGEGKIIITIKGTTDGISITVQDNGPGIDGNIRDKSTGNRVSMQIVDERIKLMGKDSFINFESNNHGTKVIIHLSNIQS